MIKSAQTTTDVENLTLSLFHSLWETKRENYMMQVYTILSNTLAKVLFHVYGYSMMSSGFMIKDLQIKVR